MIRFEVRGEPKPQARHRSGKWGNYDPSADDKDNFLTIAHKHAPEVPFEGPLQLKLIFYHVRPKGHFGTGRNADKLKTWAPRFKISRPDIDNYLKFVMDALNKVYWKDDSIVVAVSMLKQYDEVPRVVVEINELNNEVTT